MRARAPRTRKAVTRPRINIYIFVIRVCVNAGGEPLTWNANKTKPFVLRPISCILSSTRRRRWLPALYMGVTQ